MGGGGGGRGLRGLDSKNQGYHQLIKMKLCIRNYNHKSMSDAKFESCSFSIFFRYVTKFLSEEGNKSSNSAIYPWKMGLTFEK